MIINSKLVGDIESLINNTAVSMVQDSLNDLLHHASVDESGTANMVIYSREDVGDCEDYNGSDEVLLKIDIFDAIEDILAEGDDSEVVINKMKHVLEKWDKG